MEKYLKRWCEAGSRRKEIIFGTKLTRKRQLGSVFGIPGKGEKGKPSRIPEVVQTLTV